MHITASGKVSLTIVPNATIYNVASYGGAIFVN